MPTETKQAEKPIEKQAAPPAGPAAKPEADPGFVPRRVKAITQTSRGIILVDADTGEDLRLPISSITVEPHGSHANAHVTLLITTVERQA